MKLDASDAMLLYTDGITESVASEDRILETRGVAERFHVLAAQGLSPSAIVKGIVGTVAGQRLRDDVTVMVIRYSPGEQPGAVS